MKRPTVLRVLSAVAAAGLVALARVLPLWNMTMRAPQYPKGLRLTAYGTTMTGDIRELNILNHYIGMPPIEAPAFETSMFPIGVAVLVVLCAISPLNRWLRRLAVFAAIVTPLLIVLDLQWRLYTFGHTLNPQAPIRLKPFTPLVIGTSHMGNFVSSGMVASGVFCLLAAAVVLILGARMARRFETPVRRSTVRRPAIAAAIAGLFIAGHSGVSAESQTLQDRIAQALPGSTIVVDGGTHAGPLRIHGPLTVIGRNNPVIDGRGAESVVSIDGDDVVFRGFVVRNSGREVTEEAAGIKATGNRHRIERNDVRDVYFGIHVGGGDGYRVEENTIVPGVRHGARPGHGISVWNARDSKITGNHISDARDGVYLSFTDGAIVTGNDIRGCRYGLHSMSSRSATMSDNTLAGNLLGAALMQSDKLVLRANRIEDHRQGSAAYGVLLKDIGDLLAEDNVIVANRVGVYAEGVPLGPRHQAVMTRNTIAGNETGLALQSTAALTIVENRIADNLADVRPLGRRLSPSLKWSRDGRGNSWSQYRGYDANRDGVGDLPYTVNEPMDALIRKSPMVQAFLYTPAHLALEAAARMFPLYRDEPVLVDEHPLMSLTLRGAR